MADKTLKYEIEMDASGAIKSMKQFRDETGKAEGSTKKASSAIDEFNSVATRMAAPVLAVAAAWKTASVALNEFESRVGIVNRFTGDIEEAKQRTNGLLSELELMTAANRAAEAGLKLTATQFADVAVKATEYAAATGKDAVQAVDELTLALASGEREGLKRFGLAVNGVVGNVATSQAALKKLSKEVHGVSSSADTLAGKILTLNAAVDDFTTHSIMRLNKEINHTVELFSGAAGSKGLAGSFDIVGTAVDLAVAPFERFNEALKHAYVLASSVGPAVESAIGILRKPLDFDHTKRELQQLGKEVAGFYEKAFADPSANAAKGGLWFDMMEGVGRPEGFRVDQAGPGVTGSPRRSGGSASNQSEQLRPGGIRSLGVTSRSLQGDPFGTRLASQQRSLSATASNDTGFGNQSALSMEKLNALPGYTKDVGELEAAFSSLFDQGTAAEQFASSIGGALNTMQGSIASTINESVRMQKSLSETFEQLAINLVRSIGEYLVNEGVKNILVGTASLFTGTPQAGLIGVGTAQVAAGVGMGALAASASAPAGGGAGAAGPTSQPQAPPSNSQDTGQAQTVIVQFTAPIPKDRVGQDTDSAIRAASRRDGTRRVRAAG